MEDTKPMILKQTAQDTATGSAWTALSQKQFGDLIPELPIAVVHAIHMPSNVTDAPTHEEAVNEMIGSIQVSGVDLGLITRFNSGKDYVALMRALFGIKSLALRALAADNAFGALPIPIPFRFPLDNKKMGLPARSKGSYTGWVAMGTSSATDGLKLAYVADVIKGEAPSEILKIDFVAVTSQAAEQDQVKVTKPGKLVGLMLFDTTQEDTTNVDILIGGISQNWSTYSIVEFGKTYLRHKSGALAGMNALAADCDNELYTFFGFGDDPEKWPALDGKELSFKALCGTAEAKRLYIVTAEKIPA